MVKQNLVFSVISTLNVLVMAAIWTNQSAATRKQIVYGNPSVAVCPTANCPSPPARPILATQVLHGRTTQSAARSEWLSTVGLFVDTGAQNSADPFSGQKVAQYVGVLQAPGAGTVWSLNTDTVRNGLPGGPNSFDGFEGSGTPGAPGGVGVKNGTIGYELDFTNWDSDSAPGSGAFTVGQYFHAQGSFTSLSALYFDANMAPNKKAWHAGLLFNGHDVISEHTVLDASDSNRSFTVRGKHHIGIDMSGANTDMQALVLREGQSACFNEAGNCVRFQAGRLTISNTKGRTVFMIDENGDLFLKGRVHTLEK